MLLASCFRTVKIKPVEMLVERSTFLHFLFICDMRGVHWTWQCLIVHLLVAYLQNLWLHPRLGHMIYNFQSGQEKRVGKESKDVLTNSWSDLNRLLLMSTGCQGKAFDNTSRGGWWHVLSPGCSDHHAACFLEVSPGDASFASFASSRYRLHAAMDNLDESNPKKTNRLQVTRWTQWTLRSCLKLPNSAKMHQSILLKRSYSHWPQGLLSSIAPLSRLRV